MEEQRLILNDSLTINGGEAGLSGGFLWCWIRGYTIAEASRIFMDPKKTEKIEYQYEGSSVVYRGYTNCTVLQQDADGQISVCMTKG